MRYGISCVLGFVKQANSKWADGPISSFSLDVGEVALACLTAVEKIQYSSLKEEPIKTTAILESCSNKWQEKHPQRFRKHASMDPPTFQQLMKNLQDEPAFLNNSSNGEVQLPIDHQILIVLIGFSGSWEWELRWSPHGFGLH